MIVRKTPRDFFKQISESPKKDESRIVSIIKKRIGIKESRDMAYEKVGREWGVHDIKSNILIFRVLLGAIEPVHGEVGFMVQSYNKKSKEFNSNFFPSFEDSVKCAKSAYQQYHDINTRKTIEMSF